MTAVGTTCPRCQREAPAGACFCPACGSRLAAAPARPLHRDRSRAKIAGVCAGLADYFAVDVTLVRVFYLVATFFTGVAPGIVLYFILALVMPAE